MRRNEKSENLYGPTFHERVEDDGIQLLVAVEVKHVDQVHKLHALLQFVDVPGTVARIAYASQQSYGTLLVKR